MPTQAQKILLNKHMQEFNDDYEIVIAIDRASGIFDYSELGGGIKGYCFDITKTKSIIFGFANECYGYSVDTQRGENLSNGEMEDNNPTVREMIRYMKRVLRRYKIDYSKWKTQTPPEKEVPTKIKDYIKKRNRVLYAIRRKEATEDHDVYYEAKRNGELLCCWPTEEEARKHIDDLMHTVILKTKKIESYFRGVVRQYNNEYFVTCLSYSGGNPPILDILDFKGKTEYDLLVQISIFAKKHNLIME